MEQYQDEQIRLKKTLEELEKMYHKTTNSIQDYDQQYKELKKYMVDYNNEMDKMEIYTSQQTLFTIDKIGVTKLSEQDKLKKLIDSPYFGRFDFVYEGDAITEAESFYIGRFGFASEEGEQLVYDWRTPVATMYYEFEVEKSFYFAMNQQIDGEIIRKRQFKIQNKTFEYILENTLTIQDEVLQKALSERSNEKMKSIITSIQKEQNAIIRNEQSPIFVIQGVAGSGKTSVALHRVAYLLYKYRDKLKSDRILILSPNSVFSDYISSVLPELGEEPIREITIDQLTERLLPSKYKTTSFHSQITKMMHEPKSDFANRVAIKSTMQFFNQLQQFLQQLNETLLLPQSITIAEYEVEYTYLKTRFMQYENEPVLTRLELLADDIISLIKHKRQGEVKLPSKREITKRLQKRLQFEEPLAIYKAFLTTIHHEKDFVFKNKTLEFADVYPYLYCQAYFAGIDKFEMIQHLVIDEMQDYSPVQFAVIQKLFPCKKTILGDFGQSLNPFSVGQANEFTKVFPDVRYVELKKSYRSSYEIIEYAKKFTVPNSIESMERHGYEVIEHKYETILQMEQQLQESITSFHQGDYKNCAIICKTNDQVKAIQSMLGTTRYQIIDEDTKVFEEGLSIVTIQFAKGLEFDKVLIPFVDESTYIEQYDKGLLYIACTRAMHELELFISTSTPSPFV